MTACRERAVCLVWSVALSFAGVGPFADAEFVEGSIDTTEDWKCITKFCFLAEDGKFDYEFLYPTAYGVQHLLLYYEQNWRNISQGDNCTEKISMLSYQYNQIIDLTDNPPSYSRYAGCSVMSIGGENYYNCSDRVRFKAVRPRMWYVALARCEPSVAGRTGLRLNYKMRFRNGESEQSSLQCPGVSKGTIICPPWMSVPIGAVVLSCFVFFPSLH